MMNHDDPTQRLLDRLDGVRETAPDCYVARCPAHDDKSPSLSIKRVDDRVLVNCFAGCSASEVMESVGLTLSDLFDKPKGDKPKLSDYQRKRSNQARQAFGALVHEARVLLVISHQLKEGQALNDEQLERLELAINRIEGAGRLAQ
jgi:putative DNA primase/helicase